MLIYHFGSKEGLLVEVIKLVEQRQRAALAELESDSALSAAELTRAFWRRLSAPDFAANERLFFEIYGQALQGRPGTTPLLDGIIDSWVAPVVELLERLGSRTNTLSRAGCCSTCWQRATGSPATRQWSSTSGSVRRTSPTDPARRSDDQRLRRSVDGSSVAHPGCLRC
jgi:AcrR family transcriptional regulator